MKYIIQNNYFKKILISFLFSYLLYIIYSINFFYSSNFNIIDIKELLHKNKILYHIKDDITLVTAYIKIKSKHPVTSYLNWINNILKINHTMIFFIDKSICKEIFDKRPAEYQKKTLWVTIDITDLYFYKNFFHDFNNSYALDYEKRYQTVPLYITWAEKINFLKIAALKNYFKSICFYWVDSGCFRDNNKIEKYINDWPSPKKCYEDGRIIMNEVRKPSQSEKQKLKDFNIETHIKFQKNFRNVDASLFGGQKKYIIKFFDLYYKTLKLFIKKKLFIGKEQNIYAFIAYFNKNIIKLVQNKKYFYLQKYLSKDYNSQK